MRILLTLLIFALNVHANDRVRFDLSKLNKGEYEMLEWQGVPVYIFHLNREQKRKLKSNTRAVDIVDYEKTFVRLARMYGNEKISLWRKFSIQDRSIVGGDFQVIIALSLVQGCMVKVINNELVDPCSTHRFSLDGRMISAHSSSSELSLMIPPHEIMGSQLILNGNLSSDEIIDFTPDILNSNQSNEEKFFDSIQWNKLEISKVLLAQQPTLIHAKTRVGCSAIHLAAYKDHDVLLWLLGKSDDVNLICNGGWTPLKFAVSSRNLESAKTLVKNGARYDAYCVETQCTTSLRQFLLNQELSVEEIDAYMLSIAVPEE